MNYVYVVFRCEEQDTLQEFDSIDLVWKSFRISTYCCVELKPVNKIYVLENTSKHDAKYSVWVVLRKSVYIGFPIDLSFAEYILRISAILFSQLNSSLTTVQMSQDFAFWSDQIMHKNSAILVDQYGPSIYSARFFNRYPK